MFLQICLLTAGLHYGRKLYEEWRTEGAAPEGAAGPLRALRSGGEEPSKEASPLPHEPPHPEEAAVREQLNLALVSTGLTVTASAFLPPLQFLGGVSMMYGSIPIFRKARDLVVEERRVGIEVLDSIGLIASIAARQYAISAVISLLYAAAQELRIKTEKASRRSMLEVFGRRPDDAWMLVDGVEILAPLRSLQAGDVVVVGAGAPMPVDGVVVSGGALVDQRMLTGESQPVEKGVGDKVLAMTIVLTGRLQVQVEVAGEQTAAAEISRILQSTADFSSSIELSSKRIADASVLPILALSALAFPRVGVQGTVAMLNIGIADNMRVIAPFSMLNYLRKAYDAGILVKDGRSLQTLPVVDTVVFDKTGTLTQGQLQVHEIHTFGGADEGDVLRCAAAAEHRQTHPIAQAILGEAAARGERPSVAEEARYELGFGLTARVDGKTARVGSRRFMAAQGIAGLEAIDEVEAAVHRRGHSIVYVVTEGAVLGAIELRPVLRPEAEGVLRALERRGLALYLLSGDHEEPTRAMAERLGFDGYFAGVLPMDKARKIEELQEQGRTVCFVGDGLNDAVALKKAAVSVSMSGASAAAMDSAQVMLLEQGLGRLPELFEIAGDLRSNVDDILLSAVVPAGVAAGGVLFARFTTNAVALVYAASMASGMAIALWPHREKLLARATSGGQDGTAPGAELGGVLEGAA